MPDQNETSPSDEPAQRQKAPSTSVAPLKFDTPEEAKAWIEADNKARSERRNKKLAVHEAAHAIVADHLGYAVTAINIGGQQQQKATIDSKGLGQELRALNSNDPDAVAAIKPKALDMVTCYVAGHLAEAEGDFPEEKKISDRTTPELLADGQLGKGADLNFACYALKKIGCNTQEEVLAAEARAREILELRAGEHKLIADKLYEVEYIDGIELQKLLGHPAPET